MAVRWGSKAMGERLRCQEAGVELERGFASLRVSSAIWSARSRSERSRRSMRSPRSSSWEPLAALFGRDEGAGSANGLDTAGGDAARPGLGDRRRSSLPRERDMRGRCPSGSEPRACPRPRASHSAPAAPRSIFDAARNSLYSSLGTPPRSGIVVASQLHNTLSIEAFPRLRPPALPPHALVLGLAALRRSPPARQDFERRPHHLLNQFNLHTFLRSVHCPVVRRSTTGAKHSPGLATRRAPRSSRAVSERIERLHCFLQSLLHRGS